MSSSHDDAMNDAGFRQFGRPKSIKSSDINTPELNLAIVLENKVHWLKWCAWKGEGAEYAERLLELKKMLDSITGKWYNVNVSDGSGRKDV